MTTIDAFFIVFMFVCYSTFLFGVGYNIGFDAAIDQMKKVRNGK